MKFQMQVFVFSLSSLLSAAMFLAFTAFKGTEQKKFPYEKAGLTRRQAAAHLLSRFTYGPTAKQIDRALESGLEKWFEQQLQANSRNEKLNHQLSQLESISLTNAEIVSAYQRYGDLLKMAIREGVIGKDSLDKKTQRKKLQEFAKSKGFKLQQQLLRDLVSQKVWRALYSENQLQEVMTEFWFNHFNVSFTKRLCAPFIPSYERDVIRPEALGNFEKLLIGTAQSPAMLLYLDNATSTATSEKEDSITKNKQPRRVKGLNENYAREVMELHTLGVDGGYTQKDVTEAARILTGWTIFPQENGPYGRDIKKQIEKIGEAKLTSRGFVRERDFLFVPTRHDSGDKTVLGKKFPAGSGYQEGVKLLNMLAHHPATAKFISEKIAKRFISDNPPQRVVDRMTNIFLKKNGNIKDVLRTLVYSPEFWSVEAVREKTKSPFEFIASALRSLDATVTDPFQLFGWLERMGQKIYHYQAPTGFPDKAQHWINTGSLLNRMNFGLALSSGKIPGVEINLHALNDNHEPAGVEDALRAYCSLLLPERDPSETIKKLGPLLNDPDFTQKVNNAANGSDIVIMKSDGGEDSLSILEDDMTFEKKEMKATAPPYPLAQIVGIILGSPEFQRR